MSSILGIVFALGAAFSSGVERIFRRHVAVKVDPVSYAFMFALIASLVLLPFFLSDFEIPSQPIAWGFLIITGLIWTIVQFFMFRAYQTLEASIAAPISKVKVLIALVLSIILLKETLNFEKVAGTLIIFAGLIFLSHKKGGRAIDFKNKGLYYLLGSVTFVALAIVVQKVGLNYLNIGTYAFSNYLIPMLIFLPFFLMKKVSIKEKFGNRIWPLALTAILSATYSYLILFALTFAEASVVIPIAELSSLVAVFGGIIFLKERGHISKKIFSTIIILAGAALVAIS